MALVDPYDPCPCGSGKKYKWCCHKAEPYVERSVRLQESGQGESCLGPIEEGLAKLPGNNLLLLNKAVVLMSLERDDEAAAAVDLLLSREPSNPMAIELRSRLSVVREGPAAAVARFQAALRAADESARKTLAPSALLIANALVRSVEIPPALKHAELAAEIAEDPELIGEAKEHLAEIRRNPRIHPWLKQPLALSPAPSGLDPESADSFNQALGWAREGLWDAAAAAFELLSANRGASLAADRNVGICRLWLADDQAAVAALRRFIAASPATTDVVDLAVISELIDPAKDPEQVEEVTMTWPIRDRRDLIARLVDHATVARDEPDEEEEGDDDSEPEDEFLLLDRPKLKEQEGLSAAQVPNVLADIAVGRETVKLIAFDEGGLNAIMDQFSAIAGTAVPPSHPKVKVTRRVDRAEVAEGRQAYLPPALDATEQERLLREKWAEYVQDRWADVPRATFGGRSPAQLAKSGHAEVILRAAILALETKFAFAKADWAALRARLNVPEEPAIDPATVQIDDVSPGRFRFIPLGALDDDRLVALDRRAGELGQIEVHLDCCREIVRRGHLISDRKVAAIRVYPALISAAVAAGDRQAAFDLLQEGRAAALAADSSSGASAWDMTEFQLLVRFDGPEVWVPKLLELSDRYKGSAQFGQALSAFLVQLGLIRLIPLQDRPGEFATDARLLERLIGLYGPKVQSASDYLGISASKGGIWTPGSETKGGSIWTPGAEAPGQAQGQGEDKPRIILAR
ncbi:SEC-C domain-containing protein [Aquisphaera insulae]|uniref:SEC-C domain-containing protein n=1 Tax=Aquisphaera insulae TaxID=2712864 RepID=UPI00196A5CB3|nr:SEC-C domain-containing protein [Aquisphaera insulae]